MLNKVRRAASGKSLLIRVIVSTVAITALLLLVLLAAASANTEFVVSDATTEPVNMTITSSRTSFYGIPFDSNRQRHTRSIKTVLANERFRPFRML